MTSTEEPDHGAGPLVATEPRSRWALVIGLVGVLLFAAVVGYAAYQLKHAAAPAAPGGAASASGVPVGRDSAPVTVDIYEDPRCSACRAFTLQAESALDSLINNGSTRVVYHLVAFADRGSGGRDSSRAAAAAGCAAEAGMFRRYLMLLYVNQPADNGPGLSDEQLIELGRQLGSGGRFADCVRADTYGPWVTAVTDAARQTGVTELPTVLVDGRRVEPTRAVLLQAVQAAR
jgi:protein-disulfide isomerase